MPAIDIRSAEEWEAANASEIVPLGVTSVASGFRATIDRRDVGDGLRLTRVTNGETTLHRARSHITSSDDGFAIFHLNYAGAGQVSQRDRSCTLGGLSATLYTTDRPVRFSFSAGNDGVLVQMPRELLPVGEPELSRLAVQPLAGDPLLRILRAFLESSRNELAGVDRSGRALISETLLDLVAALLRTRVSSGGRNPHVLVMRVQEFVDRAFSDPNLDVPALARQFNVSTRLLYSAFARVGASPADRIRSVRLRHARRLLQTTDMPVQSVSSLCGFAEFSTFARTFKRTYGVSPTEWRAARRQTPQRL
ncbi:MAG: AraC family transcriptional regulator [Trebonia sp.]